MSYHSRSSSEIDITPLTDILPIFFKDFRDFDIDDVKNDVKPLFCEFISSEQFNRFAEERNKEIQLRRLFSVLCSYETLLEKFLNHEAMLECYKWLVERVQNERNLPKSKSHAYVDASRYVRSTNQKHTEYNVTRLIPYLELLHAVKSLKPFYFVVLHGGLGIGKKWLTLDVCTEYSVMKSTHFKIIWLDVSQCNSPEEDLSMLQHLYLQLKTPSAASNSYQEHAFSEPLDITNRITQTQNLIKDLLQSSELKDCLVVLQNIQHKRIINRFNLGFKLLLITRNESLPNELSSKMCKKIALRDGLDESEFYELFEKHLNCSRENFPENASDIYYLSDKSPLLLSIIAESIKQKNVPKVWNNWINKLRNLDLTDNKKLSGVISHSLDILTKGLRERFAVFCIFQHSVPIPIALLAKLWNCTSHEASAAVNALTKYSFLSRDENGMSCPNATCMLPFIYSSHLKEDDVVNDKISSLVLHQKVIKYYGVEEAFQRRTEVDLCNGEHDLYFYKCIGHHLKAAGRDELFRKLYLDYGFLEQKLRAVGLAKTVGDLNYYREQITGNDKRLVELVREIRDFLPEVEEKLVASNDTCLLQYASMGTGAVHEEAEKQIVNFPQRIWFMERGNFHKRRQIISLPNVAKHVLFLDHDICLIVLDNNNMMLVNISLDCGHGPCYLNNENGPDILEARLFCNNKFIITLDSHGYLKTWAIADDVRRSLVERRSKCQEVNAVQFDEGTVTRVSRFKQKIKETTQGRREQITAFYIADSRDGNGITLNVAFESGGICVFKWNPKNAEFESGKFITMQTKMHKIIFLKEIFCKFQMVLDASGNLNFFNSRDTSQVYPELKWPEEQTNLRSVEIYPQQNGFGFECDVKEIKTIFVFDDKVLMATFQKSGDFFENLNGHLEELYCIEARDDLLKCAKLTSDSDYLIIGTNRGLIVFDMKSKLKILCGNVSESITSVDTYALDDNISKYVVICGAEGKTHLNMMALRTCNNGDHSITWSHNLEAIGNELVTKAQLEPDVFLLAQLFNIQYKNEETLFIAIDSKNRIHRVKTHGQQRNWNLTAPPEEKSHITAMASSEHLTFIAYANGAIYGLNPECLLASMSGRPIYMKLLSDTYLIASTEKSALLINVTTETPNIITIDFHIMHSFKILNDYIILINNNGFLVIDENCSVSQMGFDKNGAICDVQNSRLFIATNTCFYTYTFTEENKKLMFTKQSWPFEQLIDGEQVLTCLKVNDDGSLFAIGFKTGDIKVYKMTDKGPCYLFNPQSHKIGIQCMLFSPANDVLVSCAEQLCFWSITHMLNNPLTITNKRRSSRFTSQTSVESLPGKEEVDAHPVVEILKTKNGKNLSTYSNHNQNGNGNGNGNGNVSGLGIGNDNGHDAANANGDSSSDFNNELNEHYHNVVVAKAMWQGKIGASDKPELLSCIKFDGSKAFKVYANQNFTQFNTVDDEGVYYHLVLRNFNEIEVNANNIAITAAKQAENTTPILQSSSSAAAKTYAYPMGLDIDIGPDNADNDDADKNYNHNHGAAVNEDHDDHVNRNHESYINVNVAGYDCDDRPLSAIKNLNIAADDQGRQQQQQQQQQQQRHQHSNNKNGIQNLHQDEGEDVFI